jgi:hypothetical protein
MRIVELTVAELVPVKILKEVRRRAPPYHCLSERELTEIGS